ncbi:hypothetical protein [Streptomyces sp. CB00072]|uniref:hypothetical protein n=1 Tax=Streptomyces sp. CB00072 TaxID=1703928 RepID=UPI00130194CB|nr:hypothetical protein [Streptomyces sp. CB00072]
MDGAFSVSSPLPARDAIGLSATATGQLAEHRVRSRAFDAIGFARAQLFTGQ